MYRLGPCTCAPAKMVRVHRTGWMRLLFPQRALYECTSCGGRFLATPAQQAEMGLRAQVERLQSGHADTREDKAPFTHLAG